jgi:hypothetical protein
MIDDKEIIPYICYVVECFAVKNGYPSLKEFQSVCSTNCGYKGKKCNPQRDGFINKEVCPIPRIWQHN